MALLPPGRRNGAYNLERTTPRTDEDLCCGRRRRASIEPDRHRVSLLPTLKRFSLSIRLQLFDSLHRHSTRLDELEQKIFLLWGNLQEVKQQQAASAARDKSQGWSPPRHSSRPFECCVKEYGVRCSHPADSNAMLIDGIEEQPCSQPDCFGWERRFAMFGTTIHS